MSIRGWHQWEEEMSAFPILQLYLAKNATAFDQRRWDECSTVGRWDCCQRKYLVLVASVEAEVFLPDLAYAMPRRTPCLRPVESTKRSIGSDRWSSHSQFASLCGNACLPQRSCPAAMQTFRLSRSIQPDAEGWIPSDS